MPFLKTADDISVYLRGFENLVQWVFQNRRRFGRYEGSSGVIEGQRVFIVDMQFKRYCELEYIDRIGFLSWLKANGKLILRNNSKGYTFSKRIIKDPIECIVFDLPIHPEVPATPFADSMESGSDVTEN